MRRTISRRTIRSRLLATLAVGWLAGGAIQWWTREITGYMDVHPSQLVLAVALAAGAGAAVELGGRSSGWRGALAGLAMVWTIVVAYGLMTALAWNPVWGEGDGGETPLTLLLEAPFWIGLPSAAGLGAGLGGWRLSRRLSREGGVPA